MNYMHFDGGIETTIGLVLLGLGVWKLIDLVRVVLSW